MASNRVTVLITPFGRWKWSAIQQHVVYVPKGARKHTMGLHLAPRENDLHGAYVAAASAIAGHRRTYPR